MVLMIVLGYDGKSRGFAFCTFIEDDGCKKCKEKLDGYEFMGKKMVVNISTPATRLFVGSIPKDKTKEEFETEFRRIGVDNVSILFEIKIMVLPFHGVGNDSKHDQMSEFHYSWPQRH